MARALITVAPAWRELVQVSRLWIKMDTENMDYLARHGR